MRLCDPEFDGHTRFDALGLKTTLERVLDEHNSDQLNFIYKELNKGIKLLLQEGYAFPSNFINPGLIPLP